MTLVLLAWLTRAKWDIPYDAERGITYCDAEGRLSVTAVAAHDNEAELQQLMKEGVEVEVHSWKMEVEEPNAASIICCALQKGSELALKTTELTALALLKGEIIRQMGKDLSQMVAYQRVKTAVQLQLDTAAEDPDLPAVFDYLITNGVGHHGYVDGFIDFTRVFVDSQTRQLRLGAFVAVNKLPDTVPLTNTRTSRGAIKRNPVQVSAPTQKPPGRGSLFPTWRAWRVCCASFTSRARSSWANWNRSRGLSSWPRSILRPPRPSLFQQRSMSKGCFPWS